MAGLSTSTEVVIGSCITGKMKDEILQDLFIVDYGGVFISLPVTGLEVSAVSLLRSVFLWFTYKQTIASRMPVTRMAVTMNVTTTAIAM